MQALGKVVAALVEAKRADRPIANIVAYARTAADHACSNALRRRFPARARLAAQVRYWLDHQGGFACWQDSEGALVAGSAALSGQARKLGPAGDEAARWLRQLFATEPADHLPLGAVISAILGGIQTPISFHELVDLVARARGVRDAVAAQTDEVTGLDPVDLIADDRADATETMAQREALADLWEEVKLLPVRQAQAMLLNLRDHRQKGVIDLILAVGLTTKSGLADVMQVELEWLDEIWDDLPWDDAKIAAFLGVERIDVSNLRSVAHRRIQRRLAKAHNREDAW